MEKHQRVSIDVLERLAPWKRLAFMAACCERMIPNYRRFLADDGVGDVAVLRSALDRLWRNVGGGASDSSDLIFVANVEAQAPDPSSFGSVHASAALDAVAAISTALGSSAGMVSAPDAMEIAQLGRDTADLYVQITEGLDPNATSFEAEILMSAPMQRELKVQREDIEWLALIPDDGVGRAATVEKYAGREHSILDAA